MIITQIAFTVIILLVALSLVLMAIEEKIDPRNWLSLGRLEKAMVLIMAAGTAALFVGTLAFIWGV
jgi:hypothetical protein